MALRISSLAFAFPLLVAAAGAACAGGPMEAAAGRIVTAQRWNLWNDPQGDLVKPEAVKVQPSTRQPAGIPPAGEKAPAGSSAAAAGTDNVVLPVAGPDYVIGAGDVLDISVWKDEALTKSAIVRPDGKISFPLIGEIEAAGKMVPQLKQEMEERLAKYVTDLVFSLEVRQINSMVIYVVGRVNSPGRFALNANVNVLQALAMAGGLNPFAGRDKIKIFRQESGRTKVLPFKYDDVVDGKNLEENIELHRGDVIVVP